MDKRVIFSVAGSGKTTYIVNSLSIGKRSLIVTYTKGNLANLRKKITDKFDGIWPENIVLMTYFAFLYKFCYKPFLADTYKAKGIIYESNPNKFAKKSNRDYYMTSNRYLYSNRLSLFFGKQQTIEDVKSRIKKHFDEFIIDEVQDLAGRDFSFLENLMESDINMLFVGDFYQHTFDTSRDGTTNGKLFCDKRKYESLFYKKGFLIDNSTLINSWRCSNDVCSFIQDTIGIKISSNRHISDNTLIKYLTDEEEITDILNNSEIIKLHYQNGARAGIDHKNWGDTKGEDHYNHVCVLLNKETANKFKAKKLSELAPSTKNKLYVAITRARGNVYLIEEKTGLFYLKNV